MGIKLSKIWRSKGYKTFWDGETDREKDLHQLQFEYILHTDGILYLYVYKSNIRFKTKLRDVSRTSHYISPPSAR